MLKSEITNVEPIRSHGLLLQRIWRRSARWPTRTEQRGSRQPVLAAQRTMAAGELATAGAGGGSLRLVRDTAQALASTGITASRRSCSMGKEGAATKARGRWRNRRWSAASSCMREAWEGEGGRGFDIDPKILIYCTNFKHLEVGRGRLSTFRNIVTFLSLEEFQLREQLTYHAFFSWSFLPRLAHITLLAHH